jgi:thiamine transport system substrate-binding protein
MFVYPVNPEAALPETFAKHAQIPDQPATLTPDVIAARRDEWIHAWTDAVLK